MPIIYWQNFCVVFVLFIELFEPPCGLYDYRLMLGLSQSRRLYKIYAFVI